MSLKMKAQNLNQEQLNAKRGAVNKLIQKVLLENSDLALKKSIDSIKRQLSDVLKLFKESVEEKHNKKAR